MGKERRAVKYVLAVPLACSSECETCTLEIKFVIGQAWIFSEFPVHRILAVVGQNEDTWQMRLR